MLTPDPVLTSAILVAVVQLALTLAMIAGWLSVGQGRWHDFAAALLSFLLPILGALLARHILRRQQDAIDDAEDAKRYDL
jgi:positive regulator of sigma E activity